MALRKDYFKQKPVCNPKKRGAIRLGSVIRPVAGTGAAQQIARGSIT